ncbi:MAG: tetratricopeptide repeat protein [Spirosomataceae bacterium]
MIEIVFFYLFFLFQNFSSISSIEQRNRLKNNIEMAVKENKPDDIIRAYSSYILISTIVEPEIRMIAADAYFQVGDFEQAELLLSKLSKIKRSTTRSRILTQQSLLLVAQGDTSAAIQQLVFAIQENPANDIARFNYELLKKLYNPSAPPPPITTPESAKNQPESVENSPEKEAELASNTPSRISRETALQILENLKTSERQGFAPKKMTISSEKTENDW